MPETQTATKQAGTPSVLDLLAILPDTSFLVALAIDTDVHHRSAESLLGGLCPYKPTFYLPHIVIAEVISKLIKRTNISAVRAIDQFRHVVKRLQVERHGGPTMEWSSMFERYKKFSTKRNLRGLDTNDYVIVTEGLLLNAKIITCDARMYRIAKRAYPKGVYYVSDVSEKTPDESPKLLAYVKQLVKSSS